MKQIKCQDPRTGVLGSHYVECWDVPQRTVAGKPQRFTRDRAAHNRWRVWLVQSGLVPDIDDATFEDLRRRASQRLRRAKTAHHIAPEIHAEIVAEKVEAAKVVEAAASPLDLRRQSRQALDAMARTAGIEAPEKLPNKAAVIDAIESARG
jgi:hypothetical protein